VEISSKSLSCIASADETLLLQIFWNLFANELKYAAPEGRVSVEIDQTPSSVKIAFCDEGPGMTKRERKNAFKRYYRAKRMSDSGKGGFGIGLCMAKEVAVAMGGTLSVGTNSPKGCVFTLELPAI
jgi:two-component system sensor histidine kinase CiaH